MSKRLKVVHKPAGYEGHKDQLSIRKPNIKAILAIVGTIFACGFVGALSLVFLPPLFASPTPTPTLAVIVEPESTSELTEESLVVRMSSPVPTLSPTATATNTPTATPSPTMTITPSPTIDLVAALALLENANKVEILAQSQPRLELTIEYLDSRLNELQSSQNVTPVFYANAGIAIVSVDVALIRFLPSIEHRPMKAVPFGTELRLTGESQNGWYAVFYEGGIGWIWGGIVRIENQQ